MRQDGVDLTISSPELSEADLLTAYIEHRDTMSNRSPTSPTSKNSSFLSQLPSHKPMAPVLEETRHQSIGDETNSPVFPVDLITAIGLPHEYWLRHQSLPNIQEIGEEESSPTNRSPGFRYSLRRRNSDKTSQERKLSIKRQKAEDKSSPPKDSVPGSPCEELKRRDSADEKRKKFSGMMESSGSTSHGSTSSSTAAAKKHKKKIQAQQQKQLPTMDTKGGGAITSPSKSIKQSSTDSENSGSYVTARSCVIQISADDPPSTSSTSANGTGDAGDGVGARNTISLAEFKKSSQSTSSSVASYASARDLFGRASLDNSIVDNIPMIVVVQTSPATSELNVSGPRQEGSEGIRPGAESSTSSRTDSSSTPSTIGKRNGSPTSSTTSNICDPVGDKQR